MNKNRRNRKKEKLLRELEENPLIESGCRKIGIARSTFYRWCEEDRKFYYRSEAARLKGRDKLNDFVESKLLENVKDGQQAAIQYWLTNNSKTYQFNRTTQQRRMRQIEQEVLERHKEILQLLDTDFGLDEVVSLMGGDPEVVEEAIKEAVKGKLQWLVKHDI